MVFNIYTTAFRISLRLDFTIVSIMIELKNSQMLLYIEPTGRADRDLCLDDTARFLHEQLFSSETLTGIMNSDNEFRPLMGYKGFHQSTCNCDGSLRSHNKEYKLPCGLVTNSLSLHYLIFHRSQVPNGELEKLRLCMPATLRITHKDSDILMFAMGAGNIPESSATRQLRCSNVRHDGVNCDNCNAVNIKGPRFQCGVCYNFDLCVKCEALNTHDRSHPMIKYYKPSHVYQGIKAQRPYQSTGMR